jgi:hypothetical protein
VAYWQEDTLLRLMHDSQGSARLHFSLVVALAENSLLAGRTGIGLA